MEITQKRNTKIEIREKFLKGKRLGCSLKSEKQLVYKDCRNDYIAE